MADIVLAALNARYIHASLGLRCLLANLGPLRPRATLVECVATQRPIDIAEALLKHHPRIIGLGVYIWNVVAARELVAILTSVAPHVTLVLGGPEVSHETDGQPWLQQADHVITGEGERAFAALCQQLLAPPESPESPQSSGSPSPPPHRIAGLPLDLDRAPLPDAEFTDTDLRDRFLYVEASRGCPYRCEFCLSALDTAVRPVPTPRLLASLARLHDRGARHFRFVDRTFNLDIPAAAAILDFFLERLTPDLFVHFEFVPGRLPDALRTRLTQFGAGTLQLEIGLQTTTPDVAQRIRRPLKLEIIDQNLRWLRQHTHAHLHVDLIAGLPGETLESFAQSFDWLAARQPHEIQLGILKRLRGAPIARHTAAHGMVYSPNPPYEILQTATLSFADLQRLRRLGHLYDRVQNRAPFPRTAPLIQATRPSPFAAWLAFGDWVFQRQGQVHALSLLTLAKLLLTYLTEVQSHPKDVVRAHLAADYAQDGRRRLPGFLTDRAPAPRSRRQTERAARQRAQAKQAGSMERVEPNPEIR